MLTKEEWKDIENRLSCLTRTVYLMCDGYRVALILERMSQFSNGINVYINGFQKMKWILEKSEEAKRFYFPHKKFLLSQKERKERETFIKKWGKKRSEELGICEKSINKQYVYYRSSWNSFSSLKRHLLKNNTEIRLMTEGEILQLFEDIREMRRNEPPREEEVKTEETREEASDEAKVCAD